MHGAVRISFPEEKRKSDTVTYITRHAITYGDVHVMTIFESNQNKDYP